MVQVHRSGVCGTVSARRDGDHVVLVFFTVEILDSQNHFIFIETKLCEFPDGKQRGMLRISRANAVDDLIGLKNIFLT